MNRSPASNSALSAFFRNLPENLQTPAAIALLGSLGAHALFFATLPAFTAAEDNSDELMRKVDLVQLSPQEQGKLPQIGNPIAALPPVTPLPDTQIQLPPGLKSIPDPFPLGPSLANPTQIYPLPGLTRTPSSSTSSTVDYNKLLRDFQSKSRIAFNPPPSPSFAPSPPPTLDPTQQPPNRQPLPNLEPANPNPNPTSPMPPGTPLTNNPGSQAPTPLPSQAPSPASKTRDNPEWIAMMRDTTYAPTGTEKDLALVRLADQANADVSPENRVSVPTLVWTNWRNANLKPDELARGEIQEVNHPSAEQKFALQLKTGEVMSLNYQFPYSIQNFQQNRVIAIAQTGRDGKLVGEPILLTKTGYGFLDKAAIRYIQSEVDNYAKINKEQLDKLPDATKTVLHRFEFQFKAPNPQKAA